ncbi:CsiV family protein [Inmirania thermothiophila]|uniref:Peptidoglycan-binding protein CsiV n=1 Tax=Inmirania thermothiophila TaxID=1750597 RepID=A0A3N1Y0H6_9GAMM|nr:CsiV family protein [Inmirania thermothiophila]ROR32316.1 peptidoglycan-binding protein CsiV [Inmirania thermothiophila]
MRAALALLFALALAPAAPAQEVPTERWYQVEVVVFARDRIEGGERWAADPGMPDLDGARSVPEGAPPAAEDGAGVPEAAPPAAGDGAPVDLEPLPGDGLALAPLAARLAAAPGYRVLLHTGWAQRREVTDPVRIAWPPPAAPEAPAEALAQAAPGGPATGEAAAESVAGDGPELLGTVRIDATGLYLVAGVDLLLTEPVPAQPLLPPLAADDPLAGLLAVPARERMRIREARRVRIGELHYFDHPRFGILLQVRAEDRPLPPPEVPAAGAVSPPPAPPSR